MKLSTLCGLIVCLLIVGCGDEADQNAGPVIKPIPAENLVVTLDKIAETGKYDDILNDLSAGLEEVGMMGEAATVQQFPSFKNPAAVKHVAKQIADKLRNGQG